MKKILFFFVLLLTSVITFSQTDSLSKKKWSKIDLSNRANDHFMLQYGGDGWSTGGNDTASPSGFSRHFNAYIMFDKPFKSSPHFSLGIGIGLGSSSMFFKNTYIDLKSITSTLPFTNVQLADHFLKYKLTTVFAEVPLELRFSSNPAQPDKGYKFALGAKIGELLKAYTKGKNLENSADATIYGPQYVEKESDKRFINSTRFALTGRIGYGIISIDASYQLTDFLKTATGPVIHPYSIGITLAGL